MAPRLGQMLKLTSVRVRPELSTSMCTVVIAEESPTMFAWGAGAPDFPPRSAAAACLGDLSCQLM